MTEPMPDFPCPIRVSMLVPDDKMVILNPGEHGWVNENSTVVVGSQELKERLIDSWIEYQLLTRERDFLARLEDAIDQMEPRYG